MAPWPGERISTIRSVPASAKSEARVTSVGGIEVASGQAPDILAIPVGNAGNITSYWAGFKQYNELKSTGLPQVLGVQAAGAAPLVLGHPVENPETVATAIRIGKPARGEQALQAAEESKGRIIAVTDEEILAMQRRLAQNGVWVEPASGWLVKYEDHATAYYYDQKTKERLHPWNRFRNQYTEASVVGQVQLARRARWRVRAAIRMNTGNSSMVTEGARHFMPVDGKGCRANKCPLRGHNQLRSRRGRPSASGEAADDEKSCEQEQQQCCLGLVFPVAAEVAFHRL